jgi:hypothetical protein
MRRALVTLVCSGAVLAAPADARILYDDRVESRGHRQPSGGSDTKLLGLDALAPLVKWVATLPQAFERFVTAERREQLIRHLRDVAKGFANVNIDCESLAMLAAQPQITATDMDEDFKLLLQSIIGLRTSILKLAADLSDQWRDEGNKLAFDLANLTRARADLTNEARNRLLDGNRVEATKSLRAAAALAQDAQKIVIDFLATAAQK